MVLFHSSTEYVKVQLNEAAVARYAAAVQDDDKGKAKRKIVPELKYISLYQAICLYFTTKEWLHKVLVRYYNDNDENTLYVHTLIKNKINILYTHW